MNIGALVNLILSQMKKDNYCRRVCSLRSIPDDCKLNGMLQSLQVLGYQIKMVYNSEMTKYVALVVNDTSFYLNDSMNIDI